MNHLIKINMEVVCFLDQEICPVKRYIASLLSSSGVTDGKVQRMLASLQAKIDHVLSKGGGPCPPYSKSLHGFSFLEICHSKNSKILIRVNYFCYGDKMVLLNIYEKPDNYPSNDKKVNRRISHALKEAEMFKKRFLDDNKLYEGYY